MHWALTVTMIASLAITYLLTRGWSSGLGDVRRDRRPTTLGPHSERRGQ
jgi:hypothetical protein